MNDPVDSIISNITKKTSLFLVVGVTFGLLVGFLAAQNPQISEEQASQKLVSTLEAQSGQQLEVVSTESENGVYRVDVSDSQNQLSTYHVTKDGRMVSTGMSDLDQLRQTIVAQQNFVSCLSNRDTVLYGNSSQQATAAQIQIMGGENIVSPIFQDVKDEEVLQEAAQRGVRRVPSIYHNQSTLSGLKQMDQIADFTGCQFGNSQ